MAILANSRFRFKLKTALKLQRPPPTKGPMKATGAIPKRPSTVQKPFNLTEVVKKPPPKVEVYEFKARPVPKSVTAPRQPISEERIVTIPVTPSFMKRNQKPKNDVVDAPQEVPATEVPRRTEVRPFSFLERDKQLTRKREELVNKV